MGIYTDKIAGGYAEVSFTDHYGKEIKVTIDAEECDVREAFTIFRIDEIVVADGRQDVTCVFYDAEGDVLVTVVDSLASYVARMGGNYSWLYEILKFSDSAYNYFH